ncbi:T9SS type A sorting domain-containing protein [Winogradskyella algicola]|uniref:T9SS type A sorting domain-containing protein n=1 Tax=Winogradskyella algicola TaxID=2575815 RepID=UPI001109487C|nr:T9SS type A sorting domain-containing protein [Winogradskyella algicola]
MKKITFNCFLIMFLAGTFIGSAQTLNQNAGWPNAAWTLGGTYGSSGLLEDPTIASTNFSFDDDATGNGNEDNITATSPVIDLTAASGAGETWITVSTDLVYRYLANDELKFQYWDADAMIWVDWGPANTTTTTGAPFGGPYCGATFENWTTDILNIASFTATQLSGFRYRISYDDDPAGDDWNYGFCFQSPTITSATPPSCPEPASLMATTTSTTDVDITWMVGGSESEWTYEYGVSPYAQGGGGTSGTVMTTPSLTLMGLTPGETYDIYVQSNCGGGAGDSGYITVQWTQPNLGESCTTPISATVEADCSTATPFTIDFSTAPNIGGTGSCDATGDNRGFWYEFTTTASGGVTISNSGSNNEYVILDSCGGTEIVCAAMPASVDLVLMPSTNYRMAIWKDSFQTLTTDDFCIQEFTPPAAPNCAEAPISPVDMATDVAGGTVNLSWTAPSSGPAPTDYEVFFGETSGALTSLGLLGSTDTNVDVTGVGFNTTYYWSVLPYNGVAPAAGPCSEWSFSTGNPPPGDDCTNPFIVGALPYSDTNDTANFSDVYDGSPGASGCGSTSGYLGGNDVVYSYTAASDGSINVLLSGVGTYTGIFMYTDCSDIGTACADGGVNGFAGGDIALDDIAVTNGTTYYFVISTWPAPQTTAYTLDITENTCTNATVDYAVVNDCDVSGGFNIEVDITDMGSATDLTVSDDQGSPTQAATGVTTLTFGPYVNATDVVITVVDDNDASCTQSSSALTQAACPPVNNDCAGAIAVSDGSSVTGSTVAATNVEALTACNGGGGSAETGCAGGTGTMNFGAGIWYVITTSEGEVVTATTDNSPVPFDTEIQVFEGSCGALVCVGGDDDGGANAALSTFCWESSATGGGTVDYFIYVDGHSTSTGEFQLDISVEQTLSTASFEDEAAFTYYPNPVKNTLTLNAQNTIENVAMYNMLGQEVLRATPNAVNSELDMSNLQDGAYFVKVTIADVTKTIKVIKQ